MRFLRKVLHGEKFGRKLGFPTVNFHIGNFGNYFKPGVYACEVYLPSIRHTAPSSQLTAKKGALYFGPKGKGKNVLEINILNFEGDLYGQFLSFEVREKIRKPKLFRNLEALKKGIQEDVSKIFR